LNFSRPTLERIFFLHHPARAPRHRALTVIEADIDLYPPRSYEFGSQVCVGKSIDFRDQSEKRLSYFGFRVALANAVGNASAATKLTSSHQGRLLLLSPSEIKEGRDVQKID
jgi:hypothetical protein